MLLGILEDRGNGTLNGSITSTLCMCTAFILLNLSAIYVSEQLPEICGSIEL